MTKIVGILNLTPDSFSDGGKFVDDGAMVDHLKKMLEDGADVVDVGAESTRPGATPLSGEEERIRLEGKLEKIVQICREFSIKTGKKIQTSIDSYHYENIVYAVKCGFDIVNDVSGLKDERVIDFVAKTGIKTVLMHSENLIQNENLVFNVELDVAHQILEWGRKKIEYLVKRGVKKSQLIFDVGVGFNKNNRQSIRVLKNISRFKNLGLEIYVGHSKKRFLDDIYPLVRLKNFESLEQNFDDEYWREKSENKDEIIKLRAKKTLLVSKFLIENGVDYLRVHDVKEHKKLDF